MTSGSLRAVEAATLETFRRERPSEYFSHLSDEKAFYAHDSRVERLYRYGLKLPPEFFLGKSLIDLGAGTGENTISLARWGANCTLIEMNEEAVAVAERVFREHAPGGHTFFAKSLYDVDMTYLKERFDIAHSRGVFMHVADKPRAFDILASLARPGGYVIYGDRNTCGGVQEMLQRFAIYSLAGESDSDIVAAAEALFSEDIDRSQRAVPRTRKAIIFDRWVVQQQDDPSVAEVLDMAQNVGLQYVSSWPQIDFLGRGSSTHSNPLEEDLLATHSGSVELLWMMLGKGDVENVSAFLPESGAAEFFSQVHEVAGSVRNLQSRNIPDSGALIQGFQGLLNMTKQTWSNELAIKMRLEIFCSEVIEFIQVVGRRPPLNDIKQLIDSFSILFTGYAGVRHVDYVFYKEKKSL